MASKVAMIEKGTKTIADEVYLDIRRRIIEVEFFPGEKLSENTLAAHYGVSRTPIKSALIRLEGEKLITIQSQYGSFVSKLSKANVKEMLTIRCYIEAMVVINDSANKYDEFVKDLKHNIVLQRNLAATSRDIYEKARMFYELDNEMHRMIFGMHDKENLWEYIVNSFPQLQIFRVLSIVRETEFYNQKVDEHQRICEFILSNNRDDILDEYVKHIYEEDFKLLEQVIEKFPKYFID